MLNNQFKGLACLVICTSLTACNSDSSDDSNDDPAQAGPLTLNIAHINDHHSQLDATGNFEIQLDGEPTRVELGGFSRVTAAFAEIEQNVPNLLKLHAGDAITGTLYYTFYQGEADADMMNTVCFDAFALGNHEFDDSDAGLKTFLDYLADGDCDTPVLAANVKPQVGTPLAPSAVDDYIKPYMIREVDGVQVGVIGIDISGKTTNSSRPLDTTEFLDEVQTAQDTIDDLQSQGVEHIVLLTHQGYENDQTMAASLSGVDVIIGGDSHSLLGDFSALGLASSGDYPTRTTNADGDLVCIGQAWEYSKALGLMSIEFDSEGKVASCEGQASLLVGDSFQPAVEGSFADVDETRRQELLALVEGIDELRVTTPDAAADAILANYKEQIDERKQEIIGLANESFCLVRVPGETTNRSSGTPGCDTANTLAQGSDAAQLVAEAFLNASQRADFALQNAGGVRIPLPAGNITYNTASTMLPFTNVLVELDITGAEVISTLEDAVANHLDASGSDGSQPYAAGLRWDVDLSEIPGSRFSNVEVRDVNGQWAPIALNRTYVLVTNDFIAEGRDGYTTLGTVTEDGRSVNTYLLYTQSLVDYLIAQNNVSRPLRADYSHQAVVTADDVRLLD
ncbi:5'-nucleotidase C-terminal domain-containing protein [Halopseudomonas pelagia]|uniref:Bifunctional metallophosphatase/5'-nucleotidase n=1 Tax=Halopseudomonas pelagia TaxID=553151 RepID=A0AA91Z747_9GAMM|nr:5'-nucleotidase C-terminal domain-containing protein [Halopseudomonas pelagia]PCD00201.1 bifunctional metallophosphatase/5'-nucleotidase [Halopseudomonas pelagia]QFY56861.1 bifunctional metallophosphatase/5'-nucleotidase [Halopseudomonas pelagia]